MNGKHTPGPWHLLPYQYVLNEPTRARIHGANGEPVVDDANPSITDARLMAAAPDLLAALQAFTSWHADHFEDFAPGINAQLLCLANDASAAIEKATKGT